MDKKSKHILFLPRWYPHQGDPMFGLFVKKHAESAALYNMVSVLYVQGLSTSDAFTKMELFETPPLFTAIYYYKNSSCKIWNVLRYWYYLIKGYRFIIKKQGKPTINHVHILTRLGLFAFLLKKINGTPYLITEHWSRYLPVPNTYSGWIRKNLGKIVVKNAFAVLPVSLNLEKAMKKHHLINSNYKVIPNVADPIFFQEYEKKASDQAPVFIHVSTFEDRAKNISGLLRTIKRLSEKHSDFELWLVGEGMDFDAMKNYAVELDIPKNQFRFYGLKQGKALVDLYQKADYLVLFSNFENIPVVINEAQACGLPVIATHVGGISEIINKKNGFLLEPNNEIELEAVLEHVIIDKPSFNAIEIKQNARLNFSIEHIGKQLNTIYSNAQ